MPCPTTVIICLPGHLEKSSLEWIRSLSGNHETFCERERRVGGDTCRGRQKFLINESSDYQRRLIIIFQRIRGLVGKRRWLLLLWLRRTLLSRSVHKHSVPISPRKKTPPTKVPKTPAPLQKTATSVPPKATAKNKPNSKSKGLSKS